MDHYSLASRVAKPFSMCLFVSFRIMLLVEHYIVIIQKHYPHNTLDSNLSQKITKSLKSTQECWIKFSISIANCVLPSFVICFHLKLHWGPFNWIISLQSSSAELSWESAPSTYLDKWRTSLIRPQTPFLSLQLYYHRFASVIGIIFYLYDQFFANLLPFHRSSHIWLKNTLVHFH